MILWFIMIVLTLAIVLLGAIIARIFGREYLIGLYAALTIISNILANKLVEFYSFTIDAGTITYAALFLMTDMIGEFYGKKAAIKAVWVGFFANLILMISLLIAVQWPPSLDWPNQLAFATIFGNSWRIILGSMIAYLISQHFDVWIYHKIKVMTKGKLLWLRNNVSTMSSQLVDTILFSTIAFYGLFPIAPMIIGMYIVKIIIAAADTPFMYIARWYYKR